MPIYSLVFGAHTCDYVHVFTCMHFCSENHTEILASAPANRLGQSNDSTPSDRHSTKQRAEILTSTAADRVKDTKRKYNNQPNIHFNTCLGRVYLRCWWDWPAVALSVSHLVSGFFSSTRTQVDCFESLHIVQHFADGAETFTYEAHGYRPASCILVSCIGAV